MLAASTLEKAMECTLCEYGGSAFYIICWLHRSLGDRKKDKTLARDGSEGAQDGTEKSCSFVQVHSICSVSDTLFTTDAAAGKIKLMTGLSGTTYFLKHLGILYDTFGITCKASTPQPITPESEHSR